jgi:hypothetical protein
MMPADSKPVKISTPEQRRQAIQEMRELASRTRLNGEKLRDLIDAGRK